MIADATQTFGVILLVAAAVGYLGLIARRAAKGRGGGCCNSCQPSSRPADQPSPPPEQFVPSDDLAEKARKLADDRKSSDSPT